MLCSGPPYALRDELERILVGKVCVLGVGNRMHGDDGAGPRLVDAITSRAQACCLDAGLAPENYVERIVGLAPDTLLIADALDFGGSPGECCILEPEQIAAGGLSTHAPSLGIVCGYWKARMRARIVVLGIQPHGTGFNKPLSPAVAGAVSALGALLVELCADGWDERSCLSTIIRAEVSTDE